MTKYSIIFHVSKLVDTLSTTAALLISCRLVDKVSSVRSKDSHPHPGGVRVLRLSLPPATPLELRDHRQPDLLSHFAFTDEHQEDEETLQAVDHVEHHNLPAEVDLASSPVDEGADDVCHPGEAHHKEELHHDPQHLPGLLVPPAVPVSRGGPQTEEKVVGGGDEECDVDQEDGGNDAVEVEQFLQVAREEAGVTAQPWSQGVGGGEMSEESQEGDESRQAPAVQVEVVEPPGLRGLTVVCSPQVSEGRPHLA